MEAQVEDCVRLPFGKRIFCNQLVAGLFAVLRRADNLDEVVEVVEGDFVALEYVGAVFGLAQQEARAARDDFAAVLDIAFEHFLDVHLLGLALVEGKQDYAE